MVIEKRVCVGVSILVLKEDEKSVLLGKRRGIAQGGICVHGGGEYGPPGGSLKYLETSRIGSLRELSEETGLNGINIEWIDEFPCEETQSIFEDGLHIVTLYHRAKYINGIPNVMEPEECSEWKWHHWNKLPEPLFLPLRNLVAQGYNPFRGLK